MLILLAIVIFGAQALPAREPWTEFKNNYDKQYVNEAEENFRKEIFLKNLQHIEEHNEKFDNGQTSYKLGVNKFADFTEEETRSYFGGVQVPKIPKSGAASFCGKRQEVAAPESIDWRELGAIGPVKDELQCGGCWAFTAIGALEGQFHIYYNKTVVLSEQNLIDCSTEDYGCSGGWMTTAYDYIMSNGGVDTDESYPYEGVTGECRYNPGTKGAFISGYINIKSGDEEEMKNVVGTVGPVAAALNAEGDFSMYSSGIFYSETCGNQMDALTFAMVIVGYGTEDGQDYWLARNQFGVGWGMDGYIKMSRNRDNNCGISTMASYPTFYC